MPNPEINDVPDAGNDPPTRGEFATLVLEISAGAHRGASVNFEPDNIIAIGRQPDCEIILTDNGVAGHHAILTHQSGEVWLRAMDAPLRVAGKDIPPGGPHRLTPGRPVELGDAAFIVTRTVRQTPFARRRVTARIAVARTVLLVGVMALLLPAGGWLTSGTIVEAVHAARAFLGAAGGSETSDIGTGARMTGLPDMPRTGSAGSADAPRGREIAKAVGEVLRLSGIDAQTRYLGKGRVKVTGYLGDRKVLGRVIHSRAMRDIQGLEQVVAVNFDAQPQPKAPEHKEKPASSRVVAVIDGAVPYLVSNSGDYYYVGARLPNGSRLAGLHGDQIVTYDGHNNKHLSGVGMLLTKDATGGDK